MSGSRLFSTLRTLATLPDQACARPWRWPEHPEAQLEARYGLLFAIEAEQTALAAVPGLLFVRPEAAAIAGIGQAAWGDLRGLLAAVPDELLDVSPAVGEPGVSWSLRMLLWHVLVTERRYTAQCWWAVRRRPADPVQRDPGVPADEAEREGGVADLVERLAAAREDAAALADTPDASLGAPTRWAGADVNLRFRLHRFASHLTEHTLQAERELAAGGHRPGEAAVLVRRLSALRGAHELFTPEAHLERLDRRLAELAVELA